MAQTVSSDWRDQIFVALKSAEIRQVGYVPDAGHSRLIELAEADPQIRAVSLTTEEEGIALAAGAWLGGQRCALLMQSSGVGNCINMLSLAKACRFPLTMLVTMRGEWAEFNPWQVAMGSKTQAALELMDVLVYRVDQEADAADTVAAALDIAFNGGLATAGMLLNDHGLADARFRGSALKGRLTDRRWRLSRTGFLVPLEAPRHSHC